MSRAEFPRKVRAAVFLRSDGRCDQCAAKLKTGEGEIDHVLPCALGGEATLDNARLLCRICHREKTDEDIDHIRKADRQRDKHIGAFPKAKGNRRLQSRGFEPGRNAG